MVMTDHSDSLLQGEVESSVRSKGQQHTDSHELPSPDRQSSTFSITFDKLQHTYSGGFGSMNMEELLNSIRTDEEIQAYLQTIISNPGIAPSTAAPLEAATGPPAAAITNINPQFPEGEISTSSVNDTAIQHSLLRLGSLTLPSPLSKKTVDEVWYEILNQQEQGEQEHGSTTNVQEVDSAPRQAQATDRRMTLQDFLIMAGVVRGPDRPPSALLQKSSVSYQNNKSPALASGPPGYMIRPVMASGGGENVPAYQALPERTVKHAAPVAVGREVQYGVKIQNNAGGGGCGHSSPSSPVSSDSIGANQSDSANDLDRCGGLVDKEAERKQRRMIKNRESAARSRARREAYTRDLEVERNVLEEENARLRQDLEEVKRIKQQHLEEFMKAHGKGKDRKKGLKRTWSWLY